MELFIDVLALIGFAAIFYLVLFYVNKLKEIKKNQNEGYKFMTENYSETGYDIDMLHVEFERKHGAIVSRESFVRYMQFNSMFNAEILPDFTFMSDEIDEGYTFEKMKGFINGKD